MDWPMREALMASYLDKIQIRAFQKFLEQGTWIEIDGKKKFAVDEVSYAFAVGEITAQEYLDCPVSSSFDDLEATFEKRERPVGEIEPFRIIPEE